MKYLFLSCALLATAASAAPRLPMHPPVAAPAKKVAVFFNRQTTFAQLATIKQEVAKDGIALDYDRLAFDASGHLTAISFRVEFGDTKGSATEDNVPEDHSFGFVRDFTPGASIVLRIGNFK
ncbi:hypothetical protein [Hymenobacter sp. BT559]|uniref:hypothetical protein n=1 Tax=Hymenobacter sp. BT559 TaxID=2795729 RepID=UPI0018EBAE15|nr:hypothetical protein [Hymenobacter sp. BT559]MBJ6143651.1 hypothetical protein [Hymenobacter sp. BT559]